MLKTMRMQEERMGLESHKAIFKSRAHLPLASSVFSSTSRVEMSSACSDPGFSQATSFEKHSKIWWKSTTGKWVTGKVQVVLENGSVSCSFNDEIVELETGAVYPANPDILEGVDDLTKLSYLNEPSVLHNLENRFQKDLIYTNAGPVLIAINPFKKLPLYNTERLQMYREKTTKELEPHVFGITDNACKALFQDGVNQSLIISGESGAGKTETAKIAMQYIATYGGGRGIEDEILETNPLLEAFGNAKTLRNDNSSRFGKLIDIYFDESGTICGAKIQTYLLEKSRVVHQAPGERSYHVFYQLCAGADRELREHLNLRSASGFHYLSRSGCVQLDSIDDAEQFQSLVNAMDRVRISKENQQEVFEMLAAVLWLGNITFSTVGKENHVEVVRNEAAENASQLLGCQVDDLTSALCTRKITARNEVITQRLTEPQAIDSRDALAKAIYAGLFEWLVENINKSLDSGTAHKTKFISILDIYGFESFETNSFEQLCINYANERLQQFFNHHLFKSEQEEYTSEDIDWTKIDFVDNQECLDLIEKRPLGLITLLDEECSFPKATQVSLAMKFKEHLKGNARFKAERSAGFTVHHYAGEVTYVTTGFLEKNRDLLHVDLLEFLGSCEHRLPQVFASRGKLNGVDLQRRTVASKFKNQLLNLMEILENTSPHFIRCIKPNNEQLPNVFDANLALHQLHCCGVLEVVRISRSGYPTRYSFQLFAERYGFLLGQSTAESHDYLATSLSVLRKFSISPDEFQVGKTKLFFRPGQIGLLEHFRTRTLDAIVYIQARVRGYQARNEYLSLRKATIYLQSMRRRRQAKLFHEHLRLANRASITIQKFSRRMMARKLHIKLQNEWRSSVAIQRIARGFLLRNHYRQLRKVHAAAVILQKYSRGFLQARNWSRILSAAIVLQKFFRRELAKIKYKEARKQVILIQAVTRGWLCRKARRPEAERQQFEEDYVKISAQDLETDEAQKEAGVSMKNNCTVDNVLQLKRRLIETEKTLCDKEDENAELMMKLRLYEKRWGEYEEKMNNMEGAWHNQMQSLQQSLEAARRSLGSTRADMRTNESFEVQSIISSKRRAARPILPHPRQDEDLDWDDSTSVGTKTPEPQVPTFNRAGHAFVEHLSKEFEHRSQVFKDDIDFIVEVKSGEIDADLDPELELRKLKQKFDVWKRDFKVQMRETKGVLQRLETSDRNRKKWWR